MRLPVKWRLLGITGLLMFCSALPAQNDPRIGYAYPAGGSQGSTFQVTVGGQYLDGVTNVHFYGEGLAGAVIEHSKPMTQAQFNLLREELQALRDKRAASVRAGRPGGGSASTIAWTVLDEKRIKEVQEKLEKNSPNRAGNPAIAERALLTVTVATNAAPGERELRLETPLGLSNPLVFVVGDLPEISGSPARTMSGLPRRPLARNPAPRTEPRISVPRVLNGQLMPGEADRYRFSASKGDHLTAIVSARNLIPYLPDAVPGWFQAVLVLYDAKGHEVAYADDYHFQPDPVLFFEIPASGDYVIEIRDALYRGRDDFVYRLALGNLPFITSLFPLGGPAGKTTTVALVGSNLSETNLAVAEKQPGVHLITSGKAPSLPFETDTLPEILEQEPNNSIEESQLVLLPVIVNGRIGSVGDRDIYRFDGRAGDQVVAEVRARRLSSPVDSVLELTDAAGHRLAFNDDHEDKGSGLLTHHADSWLSAVLPSTGRFYLQLYDAQNKGGPEFGYRLRISPTRPDFELRVVPSSINLKAGWATPVTVYALRRDGFSGAISLAISEGPADFNLSGAQVPEGQDQVRMTVGAPPTPLKEPISLKLEGRAMIQGREIIHAAVPADDRMQAFAYRHLVPARELRAHVGGRSGSRVPIKISGPLPVRIIPGQLTHIPILGPRALANLSLELDDPPDGVLVKELAAVGNAWEIVLECDPAKTKPGLKGNLIINAFLERARPGADTKAPRNRRRLPAGMLPAIPFETVRR